MTPPESESADYLESFLASAFGEEGEGEGDLLVSARPREEEVPETVARYAVLGRIGRGGIGVVYRVQDEVLGRELAVKVLRAAHAEDAELRRRFVEEAKICSRLQHPGVVPVHEVGTLEDGRPYFTMKVVEGKTLAERLAARDAKDGDARRDLEVFARLGQTLAYAHAHGVVHGDVKPQNVMVGAFGEVQLMDWGFAQGNDPFDASPEPRPDVDPDAEGSARKTRVIGTPAYMAPEQATGRPEELTARTDVFGLGAILCEILTGAPPYLGASKSEVCALAARADQADARARLEESGEDPALVRLALRCLEPDPADRPQDAAAVAAEVEAHLDGLERKARALELEAAEARAVATEERRSRRLTLALTVTVLLALVASAATLLWIERDRSARRAVVERSIAAAEERASLLRRDARRAEAGDAGPWRDAVAAIREAARLTRSPDTTPETVSRIAAFLAELETEAASASRDADLLRRLGDLRPHMGDDRSNEALDRAYAGIVRDAGIDVDSLATLDVAAAAATLRASPLVSALVDALDEWVHHRRRREGEAGPTWRTLLHLANAADDDPWRREMRAGYESGDVRRLQTLADADATRHVSPVGLDLLARALLERGDRDGAVALYRRAARFHPGDFWIHHNLAGQLHAVRPRPDEEILRHLHMALAIRPDSAHARTDLALELLIQRLPADAAEVLAEARLLEPRYARAAFLEGAALLQLARPFEARAAAWDAVELGVVPAGPTWVQASLQTGFVDEARAFLEDRLEKAPDDAMLHSLLAAVLADDHLHDEALKHAARAIELDPGEANAYGVRAMVLLDRGDFAGASRSLRAGRAAGEDAGEPLPEAYSDWIPRLEEFEKVVPFVAHVKDGAPPPEPAGARLLLAEVALLIHEPEVALAALESAIPELEHPEPWSVEFLAARAAARAGLGAERVVPHLERALEALGRAVDAGTIPPWESLPTLRKWRLAPELETLFARDEDAAALRTAIEARIGAIRAEGVRRAAARER